MQLKVPVKVEINMVDTTIKAIKGMKKVCPKNTSKDFKMGFNYCRDRLIKTLEYIKQKEWYTEEADVVEVKHGKWKKPQFVAHRGFYEVKEFKCSVCDKIYEVKQPCNLMNYCPYCGAKMDGSDTE